MKDVQDDENIHFCQDTVENINQATDGEQTSQSSVEKTESSQSNEEKASSLCSYKKAVARASSDKTVATKLDSYLIKTTKPEKAIDEQIARMIYATNSPFRMVDHPEFIKMIHFLPPGYSPPNRIDIGGKLLDTTHKNSLNMFNLLAQDLAIPNIKEQVVQVVKYFRNKHFAAATYKAKGRLQLIMPQDVRWSTLADCLESYLKH